LNAVADVGPREAATARKPRFVLDPGQRNAPGRAAEVASVRDGARRAPERKRVGVGVRPRRLGWESPRSSHTAIEAATAATTTDENVRIIVKEKAMDESHGLGHWAASRRRR